MHAVKLVIYAWLVFLISGCTTPPPNATLLNLRPDPAIIDVETNGFLAFAPDSGTEIYLRADIKNNTSGKVFRILLTPEPEKGNIPPVVVFQLPVGDYKFTHLYSGYGKSPSMTKINPNPFYIHKKIITSFGSLNISGEEGSRLNIKNITVMTDQQDIDILIKQFDGYGISNFRIRDMELSLVR